VGVTLQKVDDPDKIEVIKLNRIKAVLLASEGCAITGQLRGHHT